MSKYEIIHELYKQCQDIGFDETADIMDQAVSSDEKRFIVAVTDCILQEKQRRVIMSNEF